MVRGAITKKCGKAKKVGVPFREVGNERLPVGAGRDKDTPVVEKHKRVEEAKRDFYFELEGFARGKIREHLQDLLEQEVSEWLGREKSERKINAVEQAGYRAGYGKARRFTMSLGTIEIKWPRVRDLGERFVSTVLPLFKRQTKEVRELIPELYLHGLASGDFELALRHLLGEGAPLSPSSLQWLKEKWQGEYEGWKTAPIKASRWAYLWADGIYVKAGIGKEKAALLVVIGVQADGTKRFLALETGYPESKEPRAEGAPAVCGGWEFGVMGGSERSVPPGPAPAVLESQDAQCDRYGKQIGAEPGQKSSASHDVRGGPRTSVKGAKEVRASLSAQSRDP